MNEELRAIKELELIEYYLDEGSSHELREGQIILIIDPEVIRLSLVNSIFN